MIITKEMIEKVQVLAVEDKLTESYFPRASALLDQVFEVTNANLKTQLSVTYCGHRNTKLWLQVPFTHLSYAYSMLVCLYDFENVTYQFNCQVLSKDNTEKTDLHVFIGAGKIAERIDAARNEIYEIINPVISECKNRIAREKLKETARWSFDRMQKFFIANQENGSVDTEKKLKQLWKGDAWKDCMWISMDGKQASFKVMRRVADEFYKAFQEIENNPAVYGAKP